MLTLEGPRVLGSNCLPNVTVGWTVTRDKTPEVKNSMKPDVRFLHPRAPPQNKTANATVTVAKFKKHFYSSTVPHTAQYF